MNIQDEINAAVRANCGHICHKRGLNKWVEECPICGCPNASYDPTAQPDFAAPFAGTSKAKSLATLTAAALARVKKRRRK